MFVNGDHDILKQTIEKNREIFPLENESDLNYINDTIFKMKVKRNLFFGCELGDLKELFDSHNKNPKEFNFDFEQLNTDKNRRTNIPHFFSKQHSIISNDALVKKFKNLENLSEIRTVTIYENYSFLVLTKGQSFGEFAFHLNDNKRTSSIFVEKGTHLISINSEIYNSYILKEKQRIKNKEMSYLISNFFFHAMTLKYFEAKFYNSFVFLKTNRGDTLYLQNDTLTSIYFILKGEVELSINCTLSELHKVLCRLTQKYSKEEIKELKTLDPKILEKKIRMKVLICSDKEILGAEEYLYSMNRICKASIISDESKVLKIELSEFKKLVNDDNSFKLNFNEIAKNRMISLINRLKNVFIDNKSIIEGELGKIPLGERKSALEKSPKNVINTEITNNYKSLNTSRNTFNPINVIKHSILNNRSTLINPIKSFDKSRIMFSTSRDRTNNSVLSSIQGENTKYDNLLINKIKKENKKIKNTLLQEVSKKNLTVIKDPFQAETLISNTSIFNSDIESEILSRRNYYNISPNTSREPPRLVKIYQNKRKIMNSSVEAGEEDHLKNTKNLFRNIFKIKLIKKSKKS